MRLFYGRTTPHGYPCIGKIARHSAAATAAFGYDRAASRWIAAWIVPSILPFLASLVVFCAGDFVWLEFAARDFYAARIGALLLPEPNLFQAALSYPLYLVGLLVFCVKPALAAKSSRSVLLFAPLFGLVAYRTYDLSNPVTLEGWSIAVTLVDIAWGMVVSSIAAPLGYAAVRIAAR
jgi:uncharacterized membrane protein